MQERQVRRRGVRYGQLSVLSDLLDAQTGLNLCGDILNV